MVKKNKIHVLAKWMHTSMLTVSRNREQTKEKDYSWSFVPGTYIFPEGRCPCCDQVIRSRWLWSVKDGIVRAYKIVSSTDQCGIRLSKIHVASDVHPHVRQGRICLGDAKTTSEALFVGMSPINAYWGNSDSHKRRYSNWFREAWNHDCPNLDD